MTTLTLTPAQAANRLGVSSTALRRAAPAYELHFGPLPREGRGGRLWTAEAVENMRLAFEAVHQNQVVSVKAALEMLSHGGDLLPVAPSGVGGRVDASTAELLAELLSEVKASRSENAELRDSRAENVRLRALVEAQERDLVALRSAAVGLALPAPAPAGGELLEEVKALRLEVSRLAAVGGRQHHTSGPEDLDDGVTVLNVAVLVVPPRLRNALRWKPQRYTDLEAVLRSTKALHLERVNGKSFWRTDSGGTVRRDIVRRLRDAGVLEPAPGASARVRL